MKQELLALQRTAEDLKRDSELAIMRAKDALRDDLARAHSRELQTREELARAKRAWGGANPDPGTPARRQRQQNR